MNSKWLDFFHTILKFPPLQFWNSSKSDYIAMRNNIPMATIHSHKANYSKKGKMKACVDNGWMWNWVSELLAFIVRDDRAKLLLLENFKEKIIRLSLKEKK